MKTIQIALLHYDGCMNTAVYGLQDMLTVANTLAQKNLFSTSLIGADEKSMVMALKEKATLDVIIIPPSLNCKYYLNPHPLLNDWLNQAYNKGALLCSACSGVFFLAQAGLLEGKTVTTHWGLTQEFKNHYPNIELDTKKILIDEGDIITAGGLMFWTDLGLALVGRFAGRAILGQLGKYLILDTARREQQYYHVMDYSLRHNDKEMLIIQHYLIKHSSKDLLIKNVAKKFALGERTLLRRFSKTTGRTPHEYIQELRIQKACNLLENTNQTIEKIAHQVGYEDLSAFRKVFAKIVGLKPLEFRKKFTVKLYRIEKQKG